MFLGRLGFLRVVFLFVLFSGAGSVWGRIQADSVRLDSVRSRLERVAVIDKAFLAEIDLSIGKLSLAEVLRNIARANGVNLCVKVDEGIMVTCNFNRTRVIDLLSYLCKEYGLEVDAVGNILSIYTPAPPAPLPRLPKVSFDRTAGLLFCDLSDDNLVEVVKQISNLAGVQIVVPRSLYSNRISGYLSGMEVNEAIATLGKINSLEIEKDKNGAWMIYAPDGQATATNLPAGGRPAPSRDIRRRAFTQDQLLVDSLGLITATVTRGNIHDMVVEVCEHLGVNRMFLNTLDQEAVICVKEIGFSDFLHVLFAGTPFTYQKEGNVYIFGSKDKPIVATRVIPLRYRTVEKVTDIIPGALKTDVQIAVFPDLNSVIAAGTSRQVEQVARFLESIDRSVPLVTIEVLIVDSRKSVIQEIGVEAGLNSERQTTSGKISPGVDVNLSSASINRLINSFNGFGSINLGKVNADFYMNLHALEQAGNIELRSTPKLSTLNGHEAVLKSGETTYYKEIQSNIFGSQTPVQSESYTWKNVEANLSLKIVPFVSQNGKITLNIEIEQSEFTARVENNESPPGTTTRSFKSIILVDNEEMVLLGGIDRNRKEKTSTGLPLVARIPVLRWVFGTKKDNKIDERLNIFIKPTVVF